MKEWSELMLAQLFQELDRGKIGIEDVVREMVALGIGPEADAWGILEEGRLII